MDEDVVEMWKEHKAESCARREKNKVNSTVILQSRKIRFQSFNNGVHLRVEGDINFWPSTGLWITKDGKRGRGVFPLIKHIRKGHENESAKTVGKLRNASQEQFVVGENDKPEKKPEDVVAVPQPQG